MGSPQRTEDEQERLNRQLSELLQELRVALPGVQLLFGFLLTVPFNQRFEEVTSAQRAIYLVALLGAALSSALLIAPAAFHRLVFKRGDRPRVIAVASVSLVAGLASLAVSITAAVLLVTSYLFSDAVAAASTAFVAAAIGGLWFGTAWIRNESRD